MAFLGNTNTVWRLWVIVAWFVLLFAFNLPPGWALSSDSDKARLFMAILDTIKTPTNMLLSIAVIVLILKVKFQPN